MDCQGCGVEGYGNGEVLACARLDLAEVHNAGFEEHGRRGWNLDGFVGELDGCLVAYVNVDVGVAAYVDVVHIPAIKLEHVRHVIIKLGVRSLEIVVAASPVNGHWRLHLPLVCFEADIHFRLAYYGNVVGHVDNSYVGCAR